LAPREGTLELFNLFMFASNMIFHVSFGRVLLVAVRALVLFDAFVVIEMIFEACLIEVALATLLTFVSRLFVTLIKVIN